MSELVVFEILIPNTENATGLVHAPELFDTWVLETAKRFGGISVLGIGLLGLWYDQDLPPWADPVEDHHNWYKIAVKSDRGAELRRYVAETAKRFGQKCIYFERCGEANFVKAGT